MGTKTLKREVIFSKRFSEYDSFMFNKNINIKTGYKISIQNDIEYGYYDEQTVYTIVEIYKESEY